MRSTRTIGSVSRPSGSNHYIAGNESTMLALSVNEGDTVYRSDLDRLYVNIAGANASMSDWQITSPVDPYINVDLEYSSAGEITYGGTGLQDLTVDASLYCGAPKKFRVRWVNTGTPNKFNLYGDFSNDTNALIVNNADASTSPTDYYKGLKLSFGSTTGHTNYDTADFEITDCGVEISVVSREDDGVFINSDGIDFSDIGYIGKDTIDDTTLLLQNKNAGVVGDGKNYTLKIDNDNVLFVNSKGILDIRENNVRVARIYTSNFGINTTFPAAKMHVTQDAGSNKPVIELDQDDDDEPFIEFDGTSEAGSSKNITTWTTGASLSGYVRVSINGTDYWMPFYSAPTS